MMKRVDQGQLDFIECMYVVLHVGLIAKPASP